MPFSENQLTTWAGQGAQSSSATTYNSIKTCIDGISWNADISYEIYLQGSYKNSTNIRGNSDVDVVLEFKSSFYSNAWTLPADEFKEYDEYYPNAKYSLDDFKAAVLDGLQKYYGTTNVTDGNKSIKILGTNGRLNSDVICCETYREYKSFRKLKTTDYAEGIIYWTKDLTKIINFPKLHYDNGVAKNQDSQNNYKPATRVIKNMKARMVDENILNDKTAPSYFVECLMYNAPNATFKSNQYSEIIPKVLNCFNAAITDGTIDQYVCQNYRRYLFGNTDQQWQLEKCKEFVNKLIQFWNAG